MYLKYKEHQLHTNMHSKQHNQTWTTSTILSFINTSSYSFPFGRTTFSNFRHVHYLTTRFNILCISIAHLGKIHTSTHEKNLNDSFSCTRIMNNVDQLQSYCLEIIPSRSYMILPCVSLFKEELPTPSYNI